MFHWPRFLAWVWAGYLLAAAMAVSLLVFNPNAGLLKTLVCLALLVPVTAWLVWIIPFARMGKFAPSRVRGFELERDRLRSTDGRWDIDLRRARVTHRHSSGIGFELEFISVRPQRGRGLDIVLTGSEHSGLLNALVASGILASPPR